MWVSACMGIASMVALNIYLVHPILGKVRLGAVLDRYPAGTSKVRIPHAAGRTARGWTPYTYHVRYMNTRLGLARELSEIPWPLHT